MPLGELASYVNGRGFKSEEWGSVGRPIIRIQNLTGTSDTFNHYDGDLDSRYLVGPGDILVSWSASLGVFVWQGPEAWLNQHIFKVTDVSRDVDGEFLFFVLLGQINTVKAKTHGSTMKHVTRRDFLSTRVPLPPLPEQRAIAHVLRTVERAKEQTEQVIAAARELKKSLMQHLFTYGPVRVDEVVQAVEFGSRLVPSGWDAEPLDVLVDPERPICYGILKPGPDVQGGVKYVQVRDYSNGRIEPDLLRRTAPQIDAQYERSRLRAGDILISIRGTAGRVAEVPDDLEGANISRESARIAPSDKIEGAYLAQYLRHEATQQFMQSSLKGVAVKGVNLRELRQLSVPVPPTHVQKDVVRILLAGDHKIAAEEQRRDALDTLFSTLLHDLMTAKIRVNDWPGFEEVA